MNGMNNKWNENFTRGPQQDIWNGKIISVLEDKLIEIFSMMNREKEN